MNTWKTMTELDNWKQADLKFVPILQGNLKNLWTHSEKGLRGAKGERVFSSNPTPIDANKIAAKCLSWKQEQWINYK